MATTKTKTEPRASRRAVTPVERRRSPTRARDVTAKKVPEKSTTPRAKRAAASASPIDAYLANVEHADARVTLTRLCAQLRELLPAATETIRYGMPAFCAPNGKVAAGFAFFGRKCGYYPHSGSVIPKLGALLDGYRTSKGGVTFPPDAPLPKKLVRALVRARLAEIAGGEPAPKATKRASARKVAPVTSPAKPRVFAMSFASLYPLYVQKAEKKGRSRQEVDEVIAWLTGYRGASLQRAIEDRVDLEAFFGAAPRWNSKADRITGVVCGVRVEAVEDPLMQKIRYLDKLVDELAKGKKMSSILRE